MESSPNSGETQAAPCARKAVQQGCSSHYTPGSLARFTTGYAINERKGMNGVA
jgi:hypothetical protein